MQNLKMFFIAVVAMIFSAAVVMAQEKPTTLTLPSVVGSNMVLQHSTTVNIWGWAKPKSKVKVDPSWLNLKKPLTVKADAEGFWILPVKTLAAGYDTHTITIKAGKEIKELTNILFGEVWLCAGQSNMEWRVNRDPEMKRELNSELNKNIRLYCTGRISSSTPQNDVPAQRKHKAQWSVCSPKSLGIFSAVAYGFGKDLQEALNVPIGLIDASYGGTPIEGWLGAEYLANNPKLAAVAKKSKHKRWKSKISHLHNANIYPIRHTTVAGTIWYQGCSNVSYGGYNAMLNGLIKSWREEFRNPTMPFYIVEIAPHTYTGIRGALLREVQARVAARTENCELVVTNDQNQIPGDIHPPKKWDVAHRLAQCALGAHYGKTTAEFRSPAYESMVVEGNAIRVSFKNVPTTLVQKGEGRINGFQLGVKDPTNEKKLIFSVAEARIEGNTVVVSAEGVENPVAVRYCFNEDMGNVFSAEGLPLGAFRSDKSRSLSARPYIEQPSDIAVKFEGWGYTKSIFTEGSPLWANTDFVMSNEYPKEFEGFEMMVPTPVDKGEMSVGGRVIASADGKIYMFTSITGATRKAPWKVLTSTYSRCAKDGKKRATFYIVERKVKAGEVVELPKFKNRWGTIVLAKSIE
ncbi:MAG: sialate O-acetylesterase [Rikenellaceae bacterium]|nr:sialate O-acetylesterase [Rikenellaceae bacterium]